MERKTRLAVYSAAHFWVDLSCAFLVFRTLPQAGNYALCLLLYNFCAFALQMPLGLLADRLDRNGAVATFGCALTALAYAVPVPAAAAVTAGVGNALFHLGGGIDVLNTCEKKAAALGVFVSPGALGLYIGTLWGRAAAAPLWIGPVGLLLLGGVIFRVAGRRSGNAPVDTMPTKDGWVLAPLFFVVVLRSWMGMQPIFPWKSEGRWALVLTLFLVLGKTVGGILMDRLGPRMTSAVTLLPAAALYLAAHVPAAGLAAVFLFNMTMPITLWAAARVMPGAKGFAFGLLTFALFLGFLPAYFGFVSQSVFVMAIIGAGSLVLMIGGWKEGGA